MVKRIPSDINLLFAVDKPLGCTSHDVVSRVGRVAGVRRVTMRARSTRWPPVSWCLVLGGRRVCPACLRSSPKAILLPFPLEAKPIPMTPRARSRADGLLTAKAQGRGVCPRRLGFVCGASDAGSAGILGDFRQWRSRLQACASGRAWIFPPVLSRFSSFSSLSVLVDEAVVWNIACTVSKRAPISALARDIGRAAQVRLISSRCDVAPRGSISLAHAIELEGVSADALRAHAIDHVSSLGLGRNRFAVRSARSHS